MQHGEYKVPGGKLVVADIETADGRIVAAQLSGDFFLEPDSALALMDAALCGAPTDATEAELVARLDAALVAGASMYGITTAGVATAVRRALGTELAP